LKEGEKKRALADFERYLDLAPRGSQAERARAAIDEARRR